MADEQAAPYGSSTTPWVRSGCPRTRSGAPEPQRAVENFPISGQRLERAHIEALALIKGAAARVNAKLGVVDKDVAEAIQKRRPRSPRVAGTRSSRWTSSRRVPVRPPT